MLLQFARLLHAGCRFLVAGRLGRRADGNVQDDLDSFLTLADVEVPAELQEMGLFEEIPESAFRMDLSSTALREKLKQCSRR